MKNMKNKKNKFDFAGVCHGVTTMGERGQIVIPLEARKELNLKPKEKLFVFSKLGGILILIKARNMQKIFEMMMPEGMPMKVVTNKKKTGQKNEK